MKPGAPSGSPSPALGDAGDADKCLEELGRGCGWRALLLPRQAPSKPAWAFTRLVTRALFSV